MSTTTERITSADGLTFAEALVRFAHVIDHLYADASRAQGLTPQQANLLCLLIDEPVGMTDLSELLHPGRTSVGMTDLSELLHLGRTRLTGLVDRVERRGLVERIPDDRDGRACRIALTGDGLQLALASYSSIAQRVEAMVDRMAETDREQVASAITQLLIRHGPAARSNGHHSAADGLTFAEALVRFAHVIDHLYADASRAQGLTPQQANLLCLLIDEPVGMTDLSELLHLGRSSLTGLVDRVERRGLVERIPDDRDGRACRIALTGDGLQLALASYSSIAQRVEAMVDRMAETDREQVASAITQLLIRHGPAARSNGHRSAADALRQSRA